jgi:hypothetical protein
MKKNSKSSVLAGVAEYVKELQVITATIESNLTADRFPHLSSPTIFIFIELQIQSQEVDRDIRRAINQGDVCSTHKGKDSFFLEGDSIDFQYRFVKILHHSS